MGAVNNRVLLILPQKTFSTVKVCRGGFCQIKKVEVQSPVLKEMAKLGPTWKIGTELDDHFQVLFYGDKLTTKYLVQDLNMDLKHSLQISSMFCHLYL